MLGKGTEDVKLEGGAPSAPGLSRLEACQKLIQTLAEKAGNGVEFFVRDGHVARKIAFQCQGPIPDPIGQRMGPDVCL